MHCPRLVLRDPGRGSQSLWKSVLFLSVRPAEGFASFGFMRFMGDAVFILPEGDTSF